MSSLNTLVLHEGEALDLTGSTPPQQLKRYLRAAYERLNERRVWQKALDRNLAEGDGADFNLLALQRTLAAPEKNIS